MATKLGKRIGDFSEKKLIPKNCFELNCLQNKKNQTADQQLKRRSEVLQSA